MLTANVIVIGDEILLGRVTDTNSGVIARKADRIGIKVTGIEVVADSRDNITRAIRTALERADIVFTTGGLGPTKDDITKSVLQEIFGGETVRNDDVTANIRELFKNRQLKLNSLTLDQALVPSTARIINNRFGTAPIMVFRKDAKTLVAMPGVPYETEGMIDDVIDCLRGLYYPENEIRHVSRLVTGISESALAGELEEFEDSLPQNYKLAYLPDSPVICLRLDCYGDNSRFDSYVGALDERLRSVENLRMIGTEEKPVARIVVERLAALGLTLSTAESCTGGNIARCITSVPGASEIFNGAVVSYANSAKMNLLGVGGETLKTYGAVSRQVVIQMADGASHALQTDCAIATSGIAGPGGGTPEKPVGTVWIAIKTPAGIVAECHRFPGNRERVIARATVTALLMLLEKIQQ